jgi:hypothetical protein
MVTVLASPGKKQDPISEITKAKKAGGVAQVLELLPSKCKSPSQTPLPAQKRQKERKKKENVVYLHNGVFSHKEE